MPARFRILWSVALAVGAVAAFATPVDARDRILDSSDAVLGEPSEPVTRTLSPVQGCHVLLETGETGSAGSPEKTPPAASTSGGGETGSAGGDCTVVRTVHGDLVVTVEPGPRIDDVLASRPWKVRVYRPSGDVPDGWQVALSTRPEAGAAGPLFAGVTAKAVDVTGDGHDELVLGYRSEGTGMILDVDVVGADEEGTPSVLAHDQLYKGDVVFRQGRLVSYRPVYRKTDANCCPTWIKRDIVRYDDGEFRVDEGRRVRSRGADVPASQLG